MKKLLLKLLLLGTAMLALASYASTTNAENVSIALSFSNGARGKCTLINKRVTLRVKIPSTASVKRSDDVLKYNCVTKSGQKLKGQVTSVIGANLIESSIFLDFGITDAITDKHKEYPTSFVIPVLTD